MTLEEANLRARNVQELQLLQSAGGVQGLEMGAEEGARVWRQSTVLTDFFGGVAAGATAAASAGAITRWPPVWTVLNGTRHRYRRVQVLLLEQQEE